MDFENVFLQLRHLNLFIPRLVLLQRIVFLDEQFGQETFVFFSICPYHEGILTDIVDFAEIFNILPTQNVHYTYINVNTKIIIQLQIFTSYDKYFSIVSTNSFKEKSFFTR